jgi:hypothetical protein
MPASQPYYNFNEITNEETMKMEFAFTRKHSGGIVMSKWILLAEWEPMTR